MNSIRVIVADDHPTFRKGLAHFLSEEADIQIIGEASSGKEAIRLARELVPDVVTLDVVMPGMNGIEAAKEIKTAVPSTSILILTAYDYYSYVVASLQAGVRGYMSKDSPINEIIEAVRMINRGEMVFNYRILSHVLGRTSSTSNPNIELPDLPDRQRQILRCVAMGMSNRTIANQLGISERTVETHLTVIHRKLNVSTRVDLIMRTLREGWLTLEDIG